MMTFEISLNRILIYAYHGVLEHENRYGTEFYVSLTVKIPYSEDMEKDAISATVSYEDLYRLVRGEMHLTRNTLEKVCLRIVKLIREKYPNILGGTLKIEKVRPPIREMLSGTASVSITF